MTATLPVFPRSPGTIPTPLLGQGWFRGFVRFSARRVRSSPLFSALLSLAGELEYGSFSDVGDGTSGWTPPEIAPEVLQVFVKTRTMNGGRRVLLEEGQGGARQRGGCAWSAASPGTILLGGRHPLTPPPVGPASRAGLAEDVPLGSRHLPRERRHEGLRPFSARRVHPPHFFSTSSHWPTK